jgi:hypothetical protein
MSLLLFPDATTRLLFLMTMIKMMEVQSMLQHFVDLREWQRIHHEGNIQETQTLCPFVLRRTRTSLANIYDEGRKVGISVELDSVGHNTA